LLLHVGRLEGLLHSDKPFFILHVDHLAPISGRIPIRVIISYYWVVRKVRAAKDLNLINEIKNLNLLRFNFPSKSAQIELSGQPDVITKYVKLYATNVN